MRPVRADQHFPSETVGKLFHVAVLKHDEWPMFEFMQKLGVPFYCFHDHIEEEGPEKTD